jgi:hypothetical protein
LNDTNTSSLGFPGMVETANIYECLCATTVGGVIFFLHLICLGWFHGVMWRDGLVHISSSSHLGFFNSGVIRLSLSFMVFRLLHLTHFSTFIYIPFLPTPHSSIQTLNTLSLYLAFYSSYLILFRELLQSLILYLYQVIPHFADDTLFIMED